LTFLWVEEHTHGRLVWRKSRVLMTLVNPLSVILIPQAEANELFGLAQVTTRRLAEISSGSIHTPNCSRRGEEPFCQRSPGTWHWLRRPSQNGDDLKLNGSAAVISLHALLSISESLIIQERKPVRYLHHWVKRNLKFAESHRDTIPALRTFPQRNEALGAHIQHKEERRLHCRFRQFHVLRTPKCLNFQNVLLIWTHPAKPALSGRSERTNGDGKVTDTTRIDRILTPPSANCQKKALKQFCWPFRTPMRPGRARGCSLKQVVPALTHRSGKPIAFAADVLAATRNWRLAGLMPGISFYWKTHGSRQVEETNDPQLAADMAKLGDCVLSTTPFSRARAMCPPEGLWPICCRPIAGRHHASRKLEALSAGLGNPVAPVMAIVGGARSPASWIFCKPD